MQPEILAASSPSDVVPSPKAGLKGVQGIRAHGL